MSGSPNARRRALLALSLTCVLPARAATPALTAVSAKPAPKLVLNDTNGGVHDIASYRGKVVLVNFWATWCEPCRYEMPSIQRLRDKLAARPFAVLLVNVDEPDARVRRFLEETKLDLPVVLDQNKTATRAWSVRVMPTSFVVGPDGRLRYRVVGDIDWSGEQAVRAVTDLLPRK